MPHSHHHDHSHSHHGAGDHADHHHSDHNHQADGLPSIPHASYRKLLISFWVILVFMLVEVACGYAFGSLTLMSDGFHMLSDAVALGLSAFAVHLGAKKATVEKTFGFKRFEILAAFGNGLTLILLCLLIGFEAVTRLIHPVSIDARSMLWVASLGLAVNIFVAWWLHHGEEEKTLNEESALVHVLGDLGASIAAVIAASVILTKGWMWADPILSMVISVAIGYAGVGIMRRSGHILVEGTPEGIDIEAVRKSMLAGTQVRSVHDLHLWTMNGRDLYLSAHVETLPGTLAEKEVVANLTLSLSRDFHVGHITLQVGQCAEDQCLNNCESDSLPAA